MDLSLSFFIGLEKLFRDFILDYLRFLASLCFFEFNKLIAFFRQINHSFLLSEMVSGLTLILEISFVIIHVLMRESMIMAVLATSR